MQTAVPSGRNAEMPTEMLDEHIGAGESDIQTDIGDRGLGLQQQACGFMQPQRDQVLGKGGAEHRAEQVRQMAGGQFGKCGSIFKRKRLREIV